MAADFAVAVNQGSAELGERNLGRAALPPPERGGKRVYD